MVNIAAKSQPVSASPLKRLITRHPFVAFIIIAFAGTWIALVEVLSSSIS